MNNYMKLTFPVLLLVASCGGEKPTKYIFDINEMQDNIATYTVSKGPMDKFYCNLTSMFWTKEVMSDIKNGKEPDVKDALDNADNYTPTVLNVYEKKIEWVDFEQETPITDGKVEVTLNGKTMTYDVIRENGTFMIGSKLENMECNVPFKKGDEL